MSSSLADGPAEPFSSVEGFVLHREQTLRYGENPEQKAAFYSPLYRKVPWQQLGGKELSYNNLLDLDATARIVSDFDASFPSAVIIKHLNPCGAATAKTLAEALQLSKKSDPRSHFGGIIGMNRTVDVETATLIAEDFAEIVLAPDFSAAALEHLAKKKNLRIVRIDRDFSGGETEIRSAAGGILLQTKDRGTSAIEEAENMTGRELSETERTDLNFAWKLSAHVKSNAIVLVRAGVLIGTGAGQMSRIDSVELALSKANTHGHITSVAVAASDAFFPFPDSIEILAKAGVRAVISPRGSRKDAEVVAAAKSAGMTLLFSQDRHFRH